MDCNVCMECGGDNNRTRGPGLCGTCYARRYRTTESGKQATRKAAKTWAKRHPERRARVARRYQERVGIIVPSELIALRRAIKALDNSTQRTTVGIPGEQGSNDGTEW